MKRELIKHADAVRDIIDIADYYSRIDLDLALRFLDELDEKLSFLVEWPEQVDWQASNPHDMPTSGITRWTSLIKSSFSTGSFPKASK